MIDMHSEIAKTTRQSEMSETFGPGAELPDKCPELPQKCPKLPDNLAESEITSHHIVLIN